MPKTIIRDKQDFLIVAALAISTFFIYTYSQCPTIYLIDSGELATVSYTLGVAHPTGYPLYTLISYFAAHVPGDVIRNLNILSALFSVVAVIFLYLTIKQILKNKVVPIICASLFAFSPTIWRISITNEVYALSGLFTIMIIYAFYRLHDERGFYIIMYLIGLSLTNHIIIFSLTLPIFLYIIFVHRLHISKILWSILFALLGLSLYLYLFTRTIGGAGLAWGNTYDLQRLFWHITGKQYQVWMFSLPLSEIISNLLNGITIFARDFLFILIIPVFFGFYYLFKSERQKFWLFLGIFLLNLLYTINYSIPDVESYFIPGLVALIFVFSYGLHFIIKYLRWFIVVPIAFIVPVVNYNSCTLRNNTFGLDFSRAYIEQLPQSSLLMCTYWDIYSPTLYLQRIRGVRQDLVIIDKELLRRTWYIKYIKHEYPQFYRKAKEEIETYLKELLKFEYNMPYDPRTIQTKFIAMLESFVDAKIDEGAYFAMPFPDRDFGAVKPDHYRIPHGLVFKVQRDTSLVEFDFSKMNLKRPEIINDKRLLFNVEIVERMVNNNIMYLDAIKRFEKASEAKAWLKKF